MRERTNDELKERGGREGERDGEGNAEQTRSGFDEVDDVRWKTDRKRREAVEGRLWVARVWGGRERVREGRG